MFHIISLNSPNSSMETGATNISIPSIILRLQKVKGHAQDYRARSSRAELLNSDHSDSKARAHNPTLCVPGGDTGLRGRPVWLKLRSATQVPGI